MVRSKGWGMSKMTRHDAHDLYRIGRKPTLEDLTGVWKVKMWRWWRFMRLDKKCISGARGYNRIFGARWGDFTVVSHDRDLKLIYDNGKIIDHLRLHPTSDDVMIGRFCIDGEYKAMFILERV